MAAKGATKGKTATKVDPVIEVGSIVVFLGYEAGTPDEEKMLDADVAYEVGDAGVEPGSFAVIADNPDFDSKKRENEETNPRFVLVDVFPEEIRIATDEEREAFLADDTEEAEAKQEEAKPAAKGKTTAAAKDKDKEVAAPAAKPAAKGKTTAAAKTTTKEEAKPAAKGKTTAAAKPAAKGKAVAKKQETKVAENTDELPELTDEDQEVLAIVDGLEGQALVDVAIELQDEAAATEYRLGGVLYHVKRSGAYLELDERYNDKGGFELFLLERMNLEYRKAMYLIDIYVGFNQAGIEDAAGVVAAIGWTKASKIARLINPENAEELIQLAEDNTVSDLSLAIKEQVTVGGTKTGGTKATRLTLKFRYFEDEAKTVEDILASGVKQFGVKDASEALVAILNEWYIQNGGGTASEAPAAAAPKTRGAAGSRKK